MLNIRMIWNQSPLKYDSLERFEDLLELEHVLDYFANEYNKRK